MKMCALRMQAAKDRESTQSNWAEKKQSRCVWQLKSANRKKLMTLALARSRSTLSLILFDVVYTDEDTEAPIAAEWRTGQKGEAVDGRAVIN